MKWERFAPAQAVLHEVPILCCCAENNGLCASEGLSHRLGLRHVSLYTPRIVVLDFSVLVSYAVFASCRYVCFRGSMKRGNAEEVHARMHMAHAMYTDTHKHA